LERPRRFSHNGRKYNMSLNSLFFGAHMYFSALLVYNLRARKFSSSKQ
jgi:hypothetical protein